MACSNKACATQTTALMMRIDQSSFQGHAFFYGLLHYCVVELLLLALAYTTPALSTGRSLFTLCAAANVWVRALLPGMMVGAIQQGLRGDESLYSALGRAVGMSLIVGFSVAGVARWRWLPQRSKARTQVPALSQIQR